MGVYSKTITTIQSVAQVAAGGLLAIALPDVSTKMAGILGIRIGRMSASPFKEPVNMRLEWAAHYANSSMWFPVPGFDYDTSDDFNESVPGLMSGTAAASAAQAVIGLTNTGAAEPQDMVYIDNPTTPAQSQFGRIKAVTRDTSITLDDILLYAVTTSCVVYRGAEALSQQIDFSTFQRLRLVIDGTRAGQPFAVDSYLITADSFG